MRRWPARVDPERDPHPLTVIPAQAQAGIQGIQEWIRKLWIPTCAGMPTIVGTVFA
jgi:hypothetical protein